MARDFFTLPDNEQLALIRKAGDHFDLPDVVIEKDLWVCWLLEKVFSLPMQMAFKGGTSLSKAYGLINRFSEDCDITIDYRNFRSELNLGKENRTQLKKISDSLKERLKQYIGETVLPHLKEQLLKGGYDKAFEITLSDDGEQLQFYYPSVISSEQGYLRDHVLLEFGVRNSTEPCEKCPITTYLAQAITEDFVFPQPIIETLSPIRTFWEKATLIHVECHRGRLANTPERLSRHWYDLCMLNNSWVGEKALSSRDILEDVIQHKKAFFNASYANYDDCLLRKFRLIPQAECLESLRRDFSQMVKAGMFHGKPMEFKDIIEGLEKLEIRLNQCP
jgi:hypothetical protein